MAGNTGLPWWRTGAFMHRWRRAPPSIGATQSLRRRSTMMGRRAVEVRIADGAACGHCGDGADVVANTEHADREIPHDLTSTISAGSKLEFSLP